MSAQLPSGAGGQELTVSAPEVPLRERTAADHDEPWNYQPYHLSDRVKLLLLKNRERMFAGEHGD